MMTAPERDAHAELRKILDSLQQLLDEVDETVEKPAEETKGPTRADDGG